MATSTLNHQQSQPGGGIAFDAFAPYQSRQQQPFADFSPTSLYAPLEDFGTDFTDSTASPISPMSPSFASYGLPQETDWLNWDVKSADRSAEFLKTEVIESPILASIPSNNNLSLSPVMNPIDLSPGSVCAADDVVVFGREGINDNQPLFQSPSPQTQHTPLVANCRLSPVIKTSPSTSPVLSSILAPTEADDQVSAKRYPSRNLKRKSSSASSDSDSISPRSSTSPPPQRRATVPKKTAHNMIEKRYRNNLNDKIAALRDSVPALRVMVHRLQQDISEMDVGEEGEEDLCGLAPAHKLNKATILSKATEYIAHLERRNQNLARENAALRNRVEGLEMLVMGGSNMASNGAGCVWN